jgi:hypothetical protein
MDTDPSGWMWFAIEVIGVLILGAALAYGLWMWRTRRKSPAVERAREDATKRLYNEGSRNP